MTCGAQGVFTRFAVEPGASPHTFDDDSEPYFFDISTMRKKQKAVRQQDNTGTRSMLATQVRQGAYLASGDVRMRMSPVYLDRWVPRILGGSKQIDQTISPTEGLDTNGSFGVLIDKVAQTEEFKDCRVNRAVISGQAATEDDEDAEPISLVMQILGRQHVVGTSFPSDMTHGSTLDWIPYVFHEGVLTINSVSRRFYGFQLSVNNFIIPRWANELYPIDLCPKGRSVTLDVDFKFDSVAAGPPAGNVNGLFEYPDAGYPGTLVLTNSTVCVTFHFNVLKAMNEGPAIRGQNELVYRLRMEALKSGVNPEFWVTNDSTV